MTKKNESKNDTNEKLINEIISLERNYYFEKKNVKTERQRKLREIIERAASDDRT